MTGGGGGGVGKFGGRAPALSEDEATSKIQKILRGILARKRVDEMRQEELEFLGMARKPRTKE